MKRKESAALTPEHAEPLQKPSFWPPAGRRPQRKPGRRKGAHILSQKRVLEAIEDLHAAGRVVSRPVLAELLGVPILTVDDHIKNLYESGLIRRVLPGIYEPTGSFRASRAVSFTRLTDGMLKLEVGDACLDLTPQECRSIASALLGTAFDFSLLASSRDMADQISDLRALHHQSKDEIRRRLEEIERTTQPAPFRARARARKGAVDG